MNINQLEPDSMITSVLFGDSDDGSQLLQALQMDASSSPGSLCVKSKTTTEPIMNADVKFKNDNHIPPYEISSLDSHATSFSTKAIESDKSEITAVISNENSAVTTSCGLTTEIGKYNSSPVVVESQHEKCKQLLKELEDDSKPEQIPVTVSSSGRGSVIDCNPTLSALLDFGTSINSEKSSTAITATALEKERTRAPYVNLTFNDDLNVNLKEFLSDSSSCGLNPSSTNSTVTTDMLLNYDKSKYTAIPLDPVGTSSPQQNPFTIVGYNIVNVSPSSGSGALAVTQSSFPLTYSHDIIQQQCSQQIPPNSSDPLQLQQQRKKQPSTSSVSKSRLRSKGGRSANSSSVVLECSEVMDSEDSTVDECRRETENGCSINLKHSGSFICSLCQGRFYTKEYLEYHLIMMHNIRFIDQAIARKFTPPAVNSASTAVDSYQNLDALRAMLQPQGSAKNTRLFYCKLCSKTYTYLRNLRKHELTIHAESVAALIPAATVSTATLANNSNIAIVAEGSSVLQVPSSSLNLPAKVVTARVSKSKSHSQQQQQCQCRVCHQLFVDAGALMIHMKQHVSTCPVCFKMFGSKRGLKLHSSVHVGSHDKPYSCAMCGKQYTHSRSLKHHMRRHTEGGPAMEPQPQQQYQDQDQDQDQQQLTRVEFSYKVEIPTEAQVQVQNEQHNQDLGQHPDQGQNSGVGADAAHEQSLLSDYLSFSFGTIEEATE